MNSTPTWGTAWASLRPEGNKKRLPLAEQPFFDWLASGQTGQSLADLGARHQVLVVTHLAQVAALADTQVVVSKQVAGGVTVAQAAVVEGESRVAEVARMLSGDMAGAAARSHAADLLAASAERPRR